MFLSHTRNTFLPLPVPLISSLAFDVSVSNKVVELDDWTPTTVILLLESFRTLYTACAERLRSVARCQSRKSWKHTRCLIILLPPNWRGALSWMHPFTDSTWDGQQLILEVTNPKTLSSVPERLCLERFVNCSCTIPRWSGVDLFLPWNHHKRGPLFRLQLAEPAASWNSRERSVGWYGLFLSSANPSFNPLRNKMRRGN